MATIRTVSGECAENEEPLGPDVADRIDDGGRCFASATEEVRGRDEIGMQELAQDHRNTPVLERQSA